jgi:AAA family ATP:ADP antiporter
MERALLQRLLKPVADLRSGEAGTALMMFAYAFLAMTSYNIIQPLTRSKFITNLGAVNIPYAIFGAGVFIGVLMLGYTRVYSLLPKRWALPITQAGMALVMLAFWTLFRTRPAWADWVSVGFFVWGNLLGVLVISQFWTLANGIYDPRQAKRLFGFIGGGVMLGGMTGSGLTTFIIESVGANTLLLWSALTLIACLVLVSGILGKERNAAEMTPSAGSAEKGVTLARAFQLLRQSKQVQIIALVIGFGSIGAALIDQQLNMASEGMGGENAIGKFLAQVRFSVSAAALVIQVWVTPRIHRYLGIGFALLMLPTSVAATAIAIVLTGVPWAAAVARITDQSLRYSVDKTTREVLFLPLPSELRQEVKPLVDVTVDRVSRGLGAILMLVLIQPWGLHFKWQQLSYVSLVLIVLWYVNAFRAKREYLTAFRQSLERRDLHPAGVRLEVADLSTVETLIGELASPDESRVLYAIEILESLDKRHLITPLLLYHPSPAVRARALHALGAVAPEIVEQWLPLIQRMITDESPEVRAAAISALVNLRHEQTTDLLRPYLQDPEPRIATTAAVVLACSGNEHDVAASEEVLSRLASDTRESNAMARKDVAAAVRQIPDPRFRPLLIPLVHDANPDVAGEAMRSVRALGASDHLFVPTLVSLLHHRNLKGSARETLVGYGERVLDALAYLLRDPGEDIWVRRHLPATIARIPAQKSVDVLIETLQDADGFLRFKAVESLEKLRRDRPDLVFTRAPIEAFALKEGLRYYDYFTLHYNLFARAKLSTDVLLATVLKEKMARSIDRLYRLLGLIYPWKEIAAARYAIERGDSRSRASAVEYVDNLLSGPIRKRLMPLIEDLPIDEKVRHANLALKSRPRDVEETLLQLINDADEIVAAAAIDLVETLKIWTLAGDVEFVLAHRDVKDWCVFEAASWALAAYRLPDNKRRSLWIEPLPAVQLASRLRHVPVFASVSVAELVRIAGMGRQIRYDNGRVLYQEGGAPEQLQFLLDGTVTAKTGGQEGREIVAPSALGFEQILEGSAMQETMRASESTVCLALGRDEVHTLLSNNTELVQGLFRMLATGSRRGERPVTIRRAAAILKLPADALTPIEKVLLLQKVPVFADVAPDEMRHLASIASEVALKDGSMLFTEGDPSSVWVMLAGHAELESATGATPVTTEAGDVVGIYETLAGSPIGRSARVTGAFRALRIERDELFDMCGQRPELLNQMLTALFRAPVETVGLPSNRVAAV